MAKQDKAKWSAGGTNPPAAIELDQEDRARVDNLVQKKLNLEQNLALNANHFEQLNGQRLVLEQTRRELVDKWGAVSIEFQRTCDEIKRIYGADKSTPYSYDTANGHLVRLEG